jgi:preprotein translocase subunit SecA
LNAKLHQKEAEIVALAGQPGTVTIATNMAGRGTDIKLTPEVREAGGLAIIGTERHESRRVDRQLRGRSGRQGDPGSSVFFVSLEDNLMRLFASDRIAKWMDRMGFKEGEVLEHNMLSKSVERAQKKVEENNFGIRKRLLEYDDVMNSQREVIYKRRRHALMGERIGIDILNMLYDVSTAVVEQCYDAQDYDDLKIELLRIMAVEAPFEERAFKSERMQNLSEQIYEKAIQSFKVKMDRLAEIANPVINNVYETQGDKYQNILVPVSDGKRIYNISCDLKEAYDTGAKGVIKSFEKSILLHTIDEQWKEHLREMDDLRQSVQNASYEQKDPLLIYKLESFNLFKTMVDTINKKAVAILMRAQIPVRQAEDVRQAAPESKTDYSRYRTEKSELPGQNSNSREGGQVPPQGEKPKPMPIRVDKKPGRNDPCYCGSGKKYKNCHGRLEE